MRTLKKQISTIVVLLFIITIIALLVYMEISRRSEAKKVASKEQLTEVEKLLERDLDVDYPETPREVVKYYSNILKGLYSGIKDEEIEGLANKILELYDEEFLQNNPESKYTKDLYSEIASWNKDERTITNYLLVNKDMEEKKTINGKKYATVYVSYTITGKGKTTEKRKYLLRQSEDNQWKILGWDIVQG